MSERPANLSELFVQTANKHRMCELRHDLQDAAAIAPPGEGDSDLNEDAIELLNKARSCALDLLNLLEQHEPEDFGSSLNVPTDKAHELTSLMDRVRAESEHGVEDSPVWRVLSSVVIEVAEPHLRNLFLFKCAVLMARADGELSSVESDFLHRMAEQMGLPGGEAHRIIQEGSTIDVSDFRGNLEDAFRTIHQLYLCALADGVVQGSEKRMLHRVASTLGVPDSQVHDILYGNQDEQGVDVLDTKALQDYLLNLSELPDNVYIPQNISPEKMESLRKTHEIPIDETIFLVYENRFLGRLLESAALTGHNLWAAPADEKIQCIHVTEIEEWHFGMRSTQIRLDDGREIHFSRDARECFQLIRKCLNYALSPI